jgi:hypothetical protein
MYESVTESFQTGHLEQELQKVQLSATRRSCITNLWVSLMSFATIALCVASQRVFIAVSIHFIINSVQKLLDTPCKCKFVMKTAMPMISLNTAKTTNRETCIQIGKQLSK